MFDAGKSRVGQERKIDFSAFNAADTLEVLPELRVLRPGMTYASIGLPPNDLDEEGATEESTTGGCTVQQDATEKTTDDEYVLM